MESSQRGTRRAGSIALLWALLLWGAAETGGATAPPCANATPRITTTTGIKPVGDPDTPDEGGHNTTKTTSTGSVVAPVTGFPVTATARHVPFTFWDWLHSFMGFFQQG